MFEQLLEKARAGDLTPELALKILEDSRHPENALKLFGLASELRDKHIGRELWWTAAIEGIMPCKLAPACSYCTYTDHEIMSEESLLKALGALEKLGFRHLHLSGGTNLAGYDKEIVGMVEAMRAVSDIDIEVNLGPSITRETVRELKRPQSVQRHEFAGDYQRRAVSRQRSPETAWKNEKSFWKYARPRACPRGA